MLRGGGKDVCPVRSSVERTDHLVESTQVIELNGGALQGEYRGCFVVL